MKKYVKNMWFTLVELIIGTTLFSVFILIGMSAFTNSLSNIQYIKSLWEEQESMLYDTFMIDELLANSKQITQFVNADSSTWYLFTLDSVKYNYPFATFDINSFTWTMSDYIAFSIKKFIPLNDIISNGTDIIFSAPWENDIKKIIDGSSILWAWQTGILNNPTGLFFLWSETYISDTGNSCIRKISNLSNCFIWQFGMPGNDNQSLISPTFITWTGKTLYIADTYDNKIKKVSDITVSTGVIDVFGNGNFWDDISQTGTSLTLSLPTGLALDGNDLYIADTGNNRIVKWNLTTWSGIIFIGNGQDKTLLIHSWTIQPSLFSISHPTSLKIYNNRLYFSEWISGVIKSISLSPPYTIQNEFWSYKNIAYFWDFEENTSPLQSYHLDNLSGAILWQDIYIPYAWKSSLQLTSTHSNTGIFTYDLSGISLSPREKIHFSFAIKSLSWVYDISYGFKNTSWVITNTSLTGIIDMNWKKYTLSSSFLSSEFINGLSLQIFTGSSLSWSQFLLDAMEVNLDNIYMNGNITNKFENNFSYLWGLYIAGTDSYVSNTISGKNYKFDILTLAFSPLPDIFHGLKNKNNRYLFDDYIWSTKFLEIAFEDIESFSASSVWIMGFKFLFRTFNGFILDKYISINK